MTTRKTYPPWSEKELETLKELYPDNDNEYIGRLLNRTPGSVKIRAVCSNNNVVIRQGDTDRSQSIILSPQMAKDLANVIKYKLEI